MNTKVSILFWHFAVTLLYLQPIFCSKNDYFFSHLLRNLKNDILSLKPGSNKTYIINSKLLGRNDSIELDIKSRAKGLHNENKISRNENDKRTYLDIGGPLNIQDTHHKVSLRDHRENKKPRNKIRKAMMREFEAIQKKHRMKIKKIMKHKDQNPERKKIWIRVLRKQKADDDHIANKTAEKPHMKVIKKIKILHLPVMRRRKAHKKQKIVANGQDGIEFGSEMDEDDSAFDEGGQIPQLFPGSDFDEEQVSAWFRNTKDLVEYVVSSVPPTTTPTTTTELSTKNVKDEYTYEYVYEDELDKNKGAKKDKHGAGDKKGKGATSDEYTYEYIYEDEMKKGKVVTTAATTPKPTTTTIPPSTHKISEETPVTSEESEEPNSKRVQPVKLSPSIENEIIKLREMEMNASKPTFGSEEYEGDSNSQYKEPERFHSDEEKNDESRSDFVMEYDWNAPALTTQAATYRIAASSIMYDDENTEEFYAERNKTKRERGYDSYPADMMFTCDLRKIQHRYTRPQLTPEDYESFDNYIDHWGDWQDMLETPKEKSKPTKSPLEHTHPCNVTRRRGLYNMTVRERKNIPQFNLEEFLRNSTALWIRNVTEETTPEERDEELVTLPMFGGIGISELYPNRKIRRPKRDLGGGMKLPRRQWEALMYLFQKVNHTRWIARLKKMRDAPNLMEMLIKRDKKKVNKKSIVYKQKAIKPKKRPKGPKRVVLKKRKPKDNRRALRVKLAAKRRQKKQSLQRRKRSVDNNIVSDNAQADKYNLNENYIDIKTFNQEVREERYKRDLEKSEVKVVRKKRKADKLSDDLLYDLENNPGSLQGTIENMTQVFQANLLETHKMSIDKAMNQAIEKFESFKDVKDFNKTEEIKVYRTFICEYKQLMEEWFVSMFFDVPSSLRRFAKKHIFKLRKDRVPTAAQMNKFFEYDNYLNLRLEMTEKVIRSTMKHFYDELEDKVFGYFYGFERSQKLFEDPYAGQNRTTLSDRDLLKLLVQTTEFDPDVKRAELKDARERMVGPTDKYGNTLQPPPDVRWK